MRPDGATDLSIFQEVLASLSEEAQLERTLNLIARRVSELARFSFCGIILAEPDQERIRLAGSHGFPPRYAERLGDMYVLPVGDESIADSPTQRAMRRSRTEVLRDVLVDDSFAPWRALAEEFGYRSLVSVPLISEGRVIGALNGYSRETRDYSVSELATVEALAGQAAVAIRLATMVETQQETIGALRQANDELEHHRAVLERAHEIHLRLTDAVIAGSGSEAVADTLADLIGRPVALTDAERALIYTSGEEEDGGGLAELVDAVLAGSDRAAPSGASVAHAGNAAAAVVGPIQIGAEVLGYVVVESAEQTTDLDLRAVEHAATVLALEIVKERVARATEARLHADFLFDLVNGRSDDPKRTAERARHYGLSLKRPHRVLVVELNDWAALQTSLELSEETGRNLHARILRMISEAIRRRFPGALISQTGDVVTAAVPTEALPDPARELEAMIAETRKRAEGLVPGLRVSAGLGSPVRGAAGFPSSHREAIQCITVMRRLGRSGEAMVIDELGVLRLVLDSNRPEELQTLTRRVLGPAIDRDRENAGSLIETLAAYVDNDRDVRICAAQLFVHANTVKYRLARVEELCEIDLKSPRDMLEVTIALLVLRLTSPGERELEVSPTSARPA